MNNKSKFLITIFLTLFLLSIHSVNAEFSLQTADAGEITGSYSDSGGNHTDTQADDTSYWYFGSNDNNYDITAYAELTYNITSLGIPETAITNLTFTLIYCHSGENTIPDCDGDDLIEGTQQGDQNVEIYNYSSGQWVDIGNLVTNDGEIKVTGSWSGTKTLLDYVNDTSNEIKVRYELDYDNGVLEDSWLVLDYAILNITYDVTPPEISLGNPINDSWINSSSVTFNFTPNDVTSEIANCTLVIDGSYNQTNTSAIIENQENNITTNLDEGIHNWTVNCTDTSSNYNEGTNTSVKTINVDITNPNVTLNLPTDSLNTTSQNIIFNFTVTDNLASTLNCSLYIDEVLNQTNSSTVNNTLTDFNITGIAEGSHQWNVTCEDKALNSNTSSTKSFIVDISFPTVNEITLNPSSEDDIDPGVTINVTANMTDAVAVDTVIFQYKQDSAVTWNNDTMDYNSGTGLYENASFTSSLPGTWNYRIWSNDTLGNAGTNTQTNLSVEYDYTWTRSPASFGIISGIITTTSDVGVLTINNTGDYTLNFDLSSDWTNTFYNMTEPFDLAAKAVKVINITATYADTTREDLITITIDATSANADPSYLTTNATLASYAGGPYFDVSIVTYSAAVTQSQNGISLNAKIKNIGNETSTNTWFNWTLPTGWTNTSGNLTRDIGNLAVGSTSWNNLTISINATTASATTVTINVNASYSENITDSDSKSVIVSCNSTDGVCGLDCTAATDTDCQAATTTVPSTVSAGRGGGAGTAALVEAILRGEEVLTSSGTFELVRGLSDTFPVSVTNIFDKTTLYNVSIKIEGYLSQYMTISPSMINEIEYNETKQFDVTIISPEYMEEGTHELTIIIIGKIIGAGVRKDLTETRSVTLVIHTVSKEEASGIIEMATSDIKDMEEAGFPTAKISKILEDAKKSLEQHNYENAKELAETIRTMRENAFKANDLIQEVKSKMKRYVALSGAFTGGVRGFGETEEVINLAIAAFEREDFDTALQRAEDARLTLALEKGEFNLLFFLADYWWAIVISVVLLSVSGVFGYQRYVTATITQKIRNLEKEEETIRKLIEETQIKHFKEKTIGAATFRKTISQHKKRISKVRQLRTKLRHKRLRLLKPEKLIKDLEEERKDLIKLLKNLQSDYFVDRKISKAEYDEHQKVYNERLAEIEDEHLTLKTKLSKRGGMKK